MIVMVRNLIKRFPKKPLLGLAVLAVALIAAGGGLAKRADAATTYTIQVTWEYVHWSAIDDGVADHTAEVYGTLLARNSATNQNVFRKLGNDGKNTCTSDWYGDGNPSTQEGLCNKKVSTGRYYSFSSTPLSASTSANQPAGNYQFGNNTVTLQVSPGQTLTFVVDLSDYDATSANDPMCRVGGSFTFTDAQLKTLNLGKSLTQSTGSSDGTCDVGIHLDHVSG